MAITQPVNQMREVRDRWTAELIDTIRDGDDWSPVQNVYAEHERIEPVLEIDLVPDREFWKFDLAWVPSILLSNDVLELFMRDEIQT